MEKINDGGPAFPLDFMPVNLPGVPTGMSLRDYFAAKATEKDLEMYVPKTFGEIADLLVSLGMISKESMDRDVSGCFGGDELSMLRCWARYKHADNMLKAREVQS